MSSEGELQCLLYNPNMLVAISKSMQAVKLYLNQFLLFLTRDVGKHVDLYNVTQCLVLVDLTMYILGME